MNFYFEEIVVNNKAYKLQHPGNRAWTKLKATLMKSSPSGGMTLDLEPILDYFFENVVIPEGEGATKLSLDGPLNNEGKPIPMNAEQSKEWVKECQEVWSSIAIPFLRGELESPYIWPKDK